MGQTAVEKITEYHLADAPPERPIRAGDYVSVWPRHIMTHGNTPAVLRKFRNFGATKVRAPRQPVICWSHDRGAPPRPELRREIEAFAREQGMDFFGDETECGLRFMIESGYVLPGSFVAASDPRSTLAGAVGAVGTPVVRTDSAMIWATGEFWWQVPFAVQVVVSGYLRPGVTGRDVLHMLRRTYDRREVHNAAVEFIGPGIGSLTMEDRFQIASGSSEWGAVTAWFPVDGVTLDYLEQRRRALSRRRPQRIHESELEELLRDPVLPDPDAGYAARIRLDLARVGPLGSEPRGDRGALRDYEAWPNGRPPEPESVEILEGFPERIRGRLVFLPVDELDTRAICGDAGDVENPTPEAIADTVLDRVDPTFAGSTRPGDILVAGYHFGCGPSLEEAATVFRAKSFPAIVAGSYAPTYRRHALNNGLIVIECPALVDRLTSALGPSLGSGQVHPGEDELEIEFGASRIHWRGETFGFPPLTRVPQLLIAARGVENLLRQEADVG